MTSEEQFEKWMDEKIPAIYQGKKVILHRYDTMSEVDEQLAKAAWKYSRETLQIELPEPVEIESVGVGCTFTTECYDISEVLECLRDQGLKVKPC